MNPEQLIPLETLTTLLALGEAPCSNCTHAERCGDVADPVACRDFAVSFMQRGIVVNEHRLPSRYWWLLAEADDLPADWEPAYWRGVTVGSAIRKDTDLRAATRRSELTSIGDSKLNRVFDSGVSDADEHGVPSATRWRLYCRHRENPPAGAPNLNQVMRAALDSVQKSSKNVAVFVDNGRVSIMHASLAENFGAEWSKHVGTYDPKTFDPEAFLDDLAHAGVGQ